MQHRFWLLPVTILVLAVMTRLCALGLGTPAGTVIPASLRMSYLAGYTGKLATASVSTTVAQSAAVVVLADAAPASVSPGQTYFIRLAVSNIGNGTDTMALSSTSTRGWPVSFIRDDNGDGIRQPTESTAVTSTLSLAADAVAKCFACVTVPSTAATAEVLAIKATSAFAPAAFASATIALPAPSSPAPVISAVPGDFNGDKVVTSADVALFNKEWLRWRQSARQAFDASIDGRYDLAPRQPGVWPSWQPIGDRTINMQDATVFVECFAKSRISASSYANAVQTYRTASLILVVVPSATYGIYQVSVTLPVGVTFRPLIGSNGNLTKVLKGSKAGSLFYTQYEAATRTIRITGNVTGSAPYSVATIMLN